MNRRIEAEARKIFEAIVDEPVENRTLLIERQCENDPALRKEVETLLDGHAKSVDFLAVPVPEWIEARANVAPAAPAARRIGPYQIVSEIGRGGMATVYLARRMDGMYEKQIALKIIDGARCSREMENRFHLELRALSRLEHPNIVRLLNGGTTDDGLVFMEMEYVDGQPLNEYFRERDHPIAGRLQVFDAVCEAVSFAHRNLVVHRDLKPSNILVTKDGAPKLLDFGIAQLIDEEAGERLTIPGQSRMTLEYASPEQVRAGAGGNSQAISTASGEEIQAVARRLGQVPR